MAGQSGRNLKIAKSKLGCRLPFESVAVGDGYASAGPLMVRKMTPEEIAQYGPPRPRLEGNKFHARIVQALKVSDTPEEAAELLGMTVGKLKQYMGANGVHYRWPKIKAEEVSEDMKAVHMSEAEAVEKLPPAVLERIKNDQIPGESDQNSVLSDHKAEGQVPPAQKAKPKTRLRTLMEKLTKEQYLAMKAEGLSDAKILRKAGVGQWLDVLSIVKKKWGLEGVGLKKQPPKKETLPAMEVNSGTVPGEDARQPGQEAENNDDVIWAVPFKNATGQAYVRVHGKGVSINSHAMHLLKGVKYVRVGAKGGLIIIMPLVRNEEGGYSIGYSEGNKKKSFSAKIGGASLSRFMTSHGFSPGKYKLVHNDARGWWEASTKLQ